MVITCAVEVRAGVFANLALRLEIHADHTDPRLVTVQRSFSRCAKTSRSPSASRSSSALMRSISGWVRRSSATQPAAIVMGGHRHGVAVEGAGVVEVVGEAGIEGAHDLLAPDR